MKLDCKVIEDLLPLYLDNVCSDSSRQIVDEHLKECEDCRKLLDSTQSLQIPYIEPKTPASDKALKKGFKKIRLRWCISIILVIAIMIPALFLAWNQYNETGIHYANIKEYYTGLAFMEQLQKGNYEKAYEYINLEELKHEWLMIWFSEDELANLEEDGLAKFCEMAEAVEELGGIEEYEYVGIRPSMDMSDGTTTYELSFKVLFNGEAKMFTVDVSDDGVIYISAGSSVLTDPLEQFCMWKEYLWQDYEGCYYDPDLETYVYPDKE